MRTATIIALGVGGVLVAGPASASNTSSQLSPVLSISKTTAPVRLDVPYAIKVTPASKAKGKRVRMQVKGMASWVNFDTFRVPPSGKIRDDVEGFRPGLGRYRVVLLNKAGRTIAKSPIVTVTWTARVP